MNIYIVRIPDSEGGPDHLHAYAKKEQARRIFGDSPDIGEHWLHGSGGRTLVEPCPELATELLGELVEFTPQPQVSVVIDVAAILSQCKSRSVVASEFIAAVLVAARS